MKIGAAAERQESPSSKVVHYPPHRSLPYGMLLTALCMGAASFSELAAQSWHQYHYDVSAQHDIQSSDELFRKIYGEDFIDEYRLLPALGEASLTPHSGHWYPRIKTRLEFHRCTHQV